MVVANISLGNHIKSIFVLFVFVIFFTSLIIAKVAINEPDDQAGYFQKMMKQNVILPNYMSQGENFPYTER